MFVSRKDIAPPLPDLGLQHVTQAKLYVPKKNVSIKETIRENSKTYKIKL